MRFSPGCCCAECEAIGCNLLSTDISDFTQESGSWTVIDEVTETSDDNAILIRNTGITADNFILAVSTNAHEASLSNSVHPYRLIFGWINSSYYWYVELKLSDITGVSATYITLFRVQSGVHTQLASESLDTFFPNSSIVICYKNCILHISTNQGNFSYVPDIVITGKYGIGTGTLNEQNEPDPDPARFDNLCLTTGEIDDSCIECNDMPTCGCGQTLPSRFLVTLSGIGNIYCTECSNLNITHILKYSSSFTEGTSLVCRYIKDPFDTGVSDDEFTDQCQHRIVLDVIRNSLNIVSFRVRIYLYMLSGAIDILDAEYTLNLGLIEIDCSEIDTTLNLNFDTSNCDYNTSSCHIESVRCQDIAETIPTFGFDVTATMTASSSAFSVSTFGFSTRASAAPNSSISSSVDFGFDMNGDIGAGNDMSANVSFGFDLDGNLVTNNDMYSNSTLSFDTSAIISINASMTSDVAFGFDIESMITGNNDLATNSDFGFDVNATISVGTNISSDIVFNFDVESSLNTNGDLTSNFDFNFDLSTILSTNASVTSNVAFDFDINSELGGIHSIESSSDINFDLNSNMSANGNMSANIAFDFSMSGDITDGSAIPCCANVPASMDVFVDTISENSGEHGSCCPSINGSYSVPLTELTSVYARYNKDVNNFCGSLKLNIFIEIPTNARETCEADVVFKVYNGEELIFTISYNTTFGVDTTCSAFTLPFASKNSSASMSCNENTSEVSMTEEA